MTIGETIKKFRREQDVTQEKLAEYLGISYQAVSKWENGSSLPDITLVVPLANFFGVSTDLLFAVNRESDDDKVKEYREKANKLFNAGDMQACIDLMREALETYPRHYELMLIMARALQWSGYSGHVTDGMTDNIILNAHEIIKLGERILNDCTDSHTRNETMQVLCTAYKAAGQNEKAVETVDVGRKTKFLL